MAKKEELTDEEKLKKLFEKPEYIELEYLGVDFKINRAVFADMDVLEYIGEVDDNPLVFPKLLRKILGKSKYSEFRKAVEAENNGIFSTLDASKLFDQITEAGETKN